jgi:hypothetical protein
MIPKLKKESCTDDSEVNYLSQMQRQVSFNNEDAQFGQDAEMSQQSKETDATDRTVELEALNRMLRAALKTKQQKVTVPQPSNIPQYKGDKLNVFTGNLV